MISKLSYLLNRCFKKTKLDFLVLRSFDEFDNKLAQCLKNHNLWILDLPDNETWNYNKFIPKENIVFTNTIEYINNIDIIITPHHDKALEATKNFDYIPKISLYHELPTKPPSDLEKQFNNLSLTVSQKISDIWKLPDKKSYIIPNWQPKLLTNTIEDFCENSLN